MPKWEAASAGRGTVGGAYEARPTGAAAGPLETEADRGNSSRAVAPPLAALPVGGCAPPLADDGRDVRGDAADADGGEDAIPDEDRSEGEGAWPPPDELLTPRTTALISGPDAGAGAEADGECPLPTTDTAGRAPSTDPAPAG